MSYVFQKQSLGIAYRHCCQWRIGSVKECVPVFLQAAKISEILRGGGRIKDGRDDKKFIGKPIFITHHILKACEDRFGRTRSAILHYAEPEFLVGPFEGGIHKHFEGRPSRNKNAANRL